MDFAAAVRYALGMNTQVLKSYVGDLSDAELLERPGPGCNPIAFQLGHLITSGGELLNAVEPGSAPALPLGFAEQHASADLPQGARTKAEYLQLLDQLDGAVLALVDRLPAAAFDAPSPERMQSYAPTMGAVVLLIATHGLMHAGQFVPVRRALGKPVVI